MLRTDLYAQRLGLLSFRSEREAATNKGQPFTQTLRRAFGSKRIASLQQALRRCSRRERAVEARAQAAGRFTPLLAEDVECCHNPAANP